MSKEIWHAGESYLVQTVTHYCTGKLEEFTDQELVFSSAAWIPDTGRLADCLKKGTVEECEPILGLLIVNRKAVVMAMAWAHKLPSVQK